MHLRWVFLSAIALGIASASAFASSSIHFRLTGEPPTLDWTLARGSHENYIIMNIMEGLTEEGPDMKPRPALAKGWEISENGRVYTFTIQPVQWSDGKPLEASHFVDSWLRLLRPKTGSNYASFLYCIENAEAYHSGKLKDVSKVGIQALSATQLQITLREPVPYFVHILSFWVTFPIRADLIQKHGANWTSPGKIATLGPYRLKDWKKGSQIALVRNPTYVREFKGADSATALIEPNDQKARALFEAGKLDFFIEATTADLLKYQSTGKIRAEQFPYLATYYLGFNTRHPVFKNVDARKAIALAIETDEIPPALQGGQIAAKGWIPPGMEGHGSEAQLHASTSGALFDARKFLSRAGYTEGQGFPKVEIWVEKFDGAEKLAQLLTSSLNKKLGIQARAKIANPSEFLNAIRAGSAAIFVNHWGADFQDPSGFFRVFTSASGTNATGWTSPEYDLLVRQGDTSPDLNSRRLAYAKAERILLQQDAVIRPLFHRRNTALLGERIQDFRISPLNYLLLKNVTLRENK